MAKKTKDSNLSFEERLEQALIPNWDEPYKLPNNWCWTHWGNCGQFVAGGAFKEKYQGQKGLPIPFYKVGSLKYSDGFGYLYDDTNTIGEDIRNELKASVVPVNSIIFAKIGEAIRLNRRSLNGVPCCIDNNLMAFIPNDKCYYKYVYYWSKGVDLYQYTNATTVPAIRKTDLESIPFPLAPYESQIEIVKRIEFLFAKLDEAREKTEEVVDGFEARKAAILQKAFSGELTEKWRRENKECSYKWKTIRLRDIVSIVKDKFDPLANENINLPYIGLEHVQKGKGIKNFGSVADVKSLKGLFRKGDILYGKLRPYLDKHGIAEFDGICSTDILIYRSKSMLVSSFVNYMFSTTSFINYSVSHSKGINLPRTSEKVISDYTLQLPDEDEMEVLVHSLGSLLEKEEKIEEAAEEIIGQIDSMKKAILARAFRGELGTNDPNEESSVELLKGILESK